MACCLLIAAVLSLINSQRENGIVPPAGTEHYTDREPYTSTEPSTGRALYSGTANKYTEIYIDVSKISNIIQNSGYANNFPINTRILLSFFDGNGESRSERFLIYGKGGVMAYDGSDYDFRFETGDYYIPKFESQNFCYVFREIKNGDYRFQKNKNIVVITFRYSSLKDIC